MDQNHEGNRFCGSPLDFVIDQKTRITVPTVERAVNRGEAMLAYQPIVQAKRPERPAFYEGLIRVIDDGGRFVPLKDFMPTAEVMELGRKIDCLALRLGIKTLADHPNLRLSVNMSARSIGYPDWIEALNEAFARPDHVAERLILEITESSAMEMPQEVQEFMQEVRVHGVSLALDDFGAGYTSFRYLRDFCFDMIKIDGQFIRRIARHPDNQVLARALLSIAHHFDMFAIAESVETKQDAQFLATMGIDCMQGYYFGAPTISPPWQTPPPQEAAQAI